jgi:hypothetical protein
MPIVKNKKMLYDVVDEDASDDILMTISEDIIPASSKTFLTSLDNEFETYRENSSSGSTNNYNQFIKKLLNEFDEFGNPKKNKIIHQVQPHDNLHVVLDNVVQKLNDFYSSVVTKDTMRKQRFVISRYSLGQEMLKVHELRGSFMKTHKITLTNTDSVPVKGFMTLPEPYMQYSKITLPGTSILDKTNLNHSSLSYWRILKKSTSLVKHTITNLDNKIQHTGNTFMNGLKGKLIRKRTD